MKRAIDPFLMAHQWHSQKRAIEPARLREKAWRKGARHCPFPNGAPMAHGALITAPGRYPGKSQKKATTMTDNNIKPTKPVDNSVAISSLRLAEAAHFDELAAQAERWGHFRMEIMHREAAAELRRLAKADSTGKPKGDEPV